MQFMQRTQRNAQKASDKGPSQYRQEVSRELSTVFEQRTQIQNDNAYKQSTKIGDGLKTVSERTASNTELSEVFGPSTSSRERTQ